MVRRGSTVRVRQLACTKALQSRPRALVHVEVLAALCVGERSPGLPLRDLEEIVDVESPYPDAA
jgi:hypothetical protein